MLYMLLIWVMFSLLWLVFPWKVGYFYNQAVFESSFKSRSLDSSCSIESYCFTLAFLSSPSRVTLICLNARGTITICWTLVRWTSEVSDVIPSNTCELLNCSHLGNRVTWSKKQPQQLEKKSFFFFYFKIWSKIPSNNCDAGNAYKTLLSTKEAVISNWRSWRLSDIGYLNCINGKNWVQKMEAMISWMKLDILIFLVHLGHAEAAQLVLVNKGISVERGQMVYVTENELQFSVPKERDSCKVEVVLNEPVTQRVGKLTPLVSTFLMQGLVCHSAGGLQTSCFCLIVWNIN